MKEEIKKLRPRGRPFQKGHTTNVGKKKRPHSEETRKKISIARKGHKLTQEHRRQISIATKGKPKSIAWRKKASIAKMEEKNPMWKGDKVGYGALHRWVKSRLPKPSKCQKCKLVSPRTKKEIKILMKYSLNTIEKLLSHRTKKAIWAKKWKIKTNYDPKSTKL